MDASTKINQITPDTDDATVARLVALYLLESERTPYWFSIAHDIGPPRFKECPVDYDWAMKKRVGIKTTDRARAEAWIIAAAVHGYAVDRCSNHSGCDLTMSIKRARDRAYFAQAPVNDSDDIPF